MQLMSVNEAVEIKFWGYQEYKKELIYITYIYIQSHVNHKHKQFTDYSLYH